MSQWIRSASLNIAHKEKGEDDAGKLKVILIRKWRGAQFKHRASFAFTFYLCL